MPEWLIDFLSEPWLQISVQAVIVGAMTAWEFRTAERPWPEALFLGLIELAVLLFLGEKLIRAPIRRRIPEWLHSSGYSVEARHDEGARLWAATAADGSNVEVRKVRDPKDVMVTITASAAIPDELRRSLAGMDAGTRGRLVEPIALEMLRYGIDVNLTEQLADAPGNVVISETVALSDEFTEAEFAKMLKFVINGSKFLGSLLSKAGPSTV